MDKTRAQRQEECQQVKAQYAGLYEDVLALLYRHDPAGINFEVNPDEYAPEVGTILPRLKTCASADDVQTVVYEDFQQWFGDIAGSRDAYQSIALELWERWRKYLDAPNCQ